MTYVYKRGHAHRHTHTHIHGFFYYKGKKGELK